MGASSNHLVTVLSHGLVSNNLSDKTGECYKETLWQIQSGASAQLLLIPETFSDNQESWDFLVETVRTVTPQIREYVKTYFGKTYLDPSFQVPKLAG